MSFQRIVDTSHVCECHISHIQDILNKVPNDQKDAWFVVYENYGNGREMSCRVTWWKNGNVKDVWSGYPNFYYCWAEDSTHS